MRKDFCIALLLITVTIGYFWPLVRKPTTTIVNDYDGLFISWVLHRVSGNILQGGHQLFEGPIFYPEPHTLTYSDLFLTDSFLALPLRLLTPEPVALFTFVLLTSQALTVVMLFFLLHEVSDDRRIATAGALTFGFSPLRLHYMGHLQMMSIEWVILALLCLIKIRQRKHPAWIGLFWLAVLLQTANSFLPGMFIVMTSAGLLLAWKELRLEVFARFRWHVLGLVIVGGLLGFLVRPYMDVSRLYHYVRPLTDVIHFSLSPEALLSSFSGWGMWVLFVLVFFLGNKTDRFLKIIWLLGAAALVMALGPALHWYEKTVKFMTLHIPLPYLFFYYVVPGFKAFRTPSRWVVLWALLWTVAGGAAAAKLPPKWRPLLVVVIIFLTAWQLPKLPTTTVPSYDAYPPLYSWLAMQPGKVVVELPMFRWGSDDFSKHEVHRMLYHLKSCKQLINGYSGFSTPSWEALVADVAQTFPRPEAIALLKERGADYIIVDFDEYWALGRTDIPPMIPGLETVAIFGNQTVYRF